MRRKDDEKEKSIKEAVIKLILRRRLSWYFYFKDC